jgi:hypothetical protein
MTFAARSTDQAVVRPILLAFFLVSVRENGVRSNSQPRYQSNERVSLRPVFELLSSTVAWVWPALARWLFVRRDQGSRPGSPAQGRPLLNAGSIVVRMAARDCAGIFSTPAVQERRNTAR